MCECVQCKMLIAFKRNCKILHSRSGTVLMWAFWDHLGPVGISWRLLTLQLSHLPQKILIILQKGSIGWKELSNSPNPLSSPTRNSPLDHLWQRHNGWRVTLLNHSLPNWLNMTILFLGKTHLDRNLSTFFSAVFVLFFVHLFSFQLNSFAMKTFHSCLWRHFQMTTPASPHSMGRGTVREHHTDDDDDDDDNSALTMTLCRCQCCRHRYNPFVIIFE